MAYAVNQAAVVACFFAQNAAKIGVNFVIITIIFYVLFKLFKLLHDLVVCAAVLWPLRLPMAADIAA